MQKKGVRSAINYIYLKDKSNANVFEKLIIISLYFLLT